MIRPGRIIVSAVLLAAITVGIFMMLPPSVRVVVICAAIICMALAIARSITPYAVPLFKPDPVAVYDPNYVREHKELLDTLFEYTRGYTMVDYEAEWLQIACKSDHYVVTFGTGDEYQVPYGTLWPIRSRSYFYQGEWWDRLFGTIKVPREVIADLHRRIDAYHGASSDELDRLLEEP